MCVIYCSPHSVSLTFITPRLGTDLPLSSVQNYHHTRCSVRDAMMVLILPVLLSWFHFQCLICRSTTDCVNESSSRFAMHPVSYRVQDCNCSPLEAVSFCCRHSSFSITQGQTGSSIHCPMAHATELVWKQQQWEKSRVLCQSRVWHCNTLRNTCWEHVMCLLRLCLEKTVTLPLVSCGRVVAGALALRTAHAILSGCTWMTGRWTVLGMCWAARTHTIALQAATKFITLLYSSQLNSTFWMWHLHIKCNVQIAVSQCYWIR
jgi:hypothetical protein